VLTLVVIGLLTVVVISKLQRVALEAQKAAVRAELVHIREGITLFKIVNKRNPESMHELMEKKIRLPVSSRRGRYQDPFFDQKYLTANAVDAKGELLDAFGNPFQYEPVSGVVRSTTKECENW
jgi:hypothetical protein